MSTHFEKLNSILTQLGYDTSNQISNEQIIIINEESKGLSNTFLDCTGSLLVVEQHICKLTHPTAEQLLSLLKMNRTTIHGAFAVDATGENLLFRDTLQLDNLDSNEIEASLNAIGLTLAENADALITISK